MDYFRNRPKVRMAILKEARASVALDEVGEVDNNLAIEGKGFRTSTPRIYHFAMWIILR